jgi:uncharacterized protein (DUF2062 family)
MRGYLRRARAWFHELLRAHLTPTSIGVAVGLGIFIGCLPIYGIHLVVCVAAARSLRLNQAILYAAANISNPFFAPFLVTAEIAVGEWLRRGDTVGSAAPFTDGSFWSMAQQAPDLFLSCSLGSLVIGGVLGAILGVAALLAARQWRPLAESPA